MAEFVIISTSNFLYRFFLIGGIFVVSLLLLELASDRPRPIGRFAYGIVWLAIVVTQYVLPSVFLAVATDDADLAAVVWLAATAGLMLILAYASRRRSVDAYGETTNAFFAVIPLICLLLLFKRSEETSHLSSRTTVATMGRALAFVGCALAVIFVASFVNGVLQATTKNAIVSVRDLPIERAVKVQSALLATNSPQAVDRETMLINSTANGKILVMEYFLTGASAEIETPIFEALMEPVVTHNLCKDPVFRDLLMRGATVVFKYEAFSKDNSRRNHRLEIATPNCDE